MTRRQQFFERFFVALFIYLFLEGLVGCFVQNYAKVGLSVLKCRDSMLSKRAMLLISKENISRKSEKVRVWRRGSQLRRLENSLTILTFLFLLSK